MPDTGALVHEAERRAERYAGLLRMAIALALAAVFLVAVIPFRYEATEVLQRQWYYAMGGMTGYFLLGLLAWILARGTGFRRWMVWPLAAGDCLFVLSGLWLSLQNTGAGPAVTLAFPSAWLIPVVLGLSAMRLDPRVLWVMTLAMGCGLAALIWASPPGSAQVTDSLSGMQTFFATPPNLMRLAMIMAAGVLLAVAVSRARGLLFRSIAETQRNANLTRYLPAEVAARLAQGDLDALRKGERQNAAILFIDMRGFTGMVQNMPPEALAELMTGFRGAILQEARASGGIVDKFMGDAAMLVYEARKSPEQAAQNCLRGARALYRALSKWSELREKQGKEAVKVGIGAHWGEVFSGVIGETDRLEYSVFGDVVNTAARLEALTKDSPYDILVSRELVDVAGAFEGWHVLPDMEIRGRQGALQVLGGP